MFRRCLPLLAATLSLGAQAEDTSWYQVEVLLFAQASAAADTIETIELDATPRWPGPMVALQPPWPTPPRPARVAELTMLWHGAGAAPRLVQVTPGLDPETEDLIRWLRALERRSASPSLSWLRELDDLPPADLVLDTAVLTGAAPDASPSASDGIGVEAPSDGTADDSPELMDDGDIALANDADMAEAVEPPRDIPVPMTLAFRQLAREELSLAAEARQLDRAGDFRLLAHFGWRAPFEQNGPGVPVAVELQDVDGRPQLLGTIDIELRRYLHADLDLYWREERDGEAAWTRVRGERRMRSSEVHYIDHPRVGALVRLTPFALDAPLSDDGAVVARAID